MTIVKTHGGVQMYPVYFKRVGENDTGWHLWCYSTRDMVKVHAAQLTRKGYAVSVNDPTDQTGLDVFSSTFA